VNAGNGKVGLVFNTATINAICAFLDTPPRSQLLPLAQVERVRHCVAVPRRHEAGRGAGLPGHGARAGRRLRTRPRACRHGGLRPPRRRLQVAPCINQPMPRTNR
jgi:hypothetical protein